MERIFVRPAVAGVLVRHPEKLSHVISQDGEWVNRTTQIERYLRVGDLVEATEPKQTKKGDK